MHVGDPLMDFELSIWLNTCTYPLTVWAYKNIGLTCTGARDDPHFGLNFAYYLEDLVSMSILLFLCFVTLKTEMASPFTQRVRSLSCGLLCGSISSLERAHFTRSYQLNKRVKLDLLCPTCISSYYVYHLNLSNRSLSFFLSIYLPSRYRNSFLTWMRSRYQKRKI